MVALECATKRGDMLAAGGGTRMMETRHAGRRRLFLFIVSLFLSFSARTSFRASSRGQQGKIKKPASSVFVAEEGDKRQGRSLAKQGTEK